MSKKHTFGFIKSEFEKVGYKLLQNYYINAHRKIKYKCNKGHEWAITWMHFSNGHRCPFCAGQGIPTIEFIRSEFEREGYILLTTKYINSQSKLDYICSNGHEHSILWHNWKYNHRCPYCAAKERAIKYHRMSLDYIKIKFEKEGYKLLTTIYKNCEQKLECICPNGHKYLINWHSWQSGQRCPKCNNNGVSRWEIEVREFLDNLKVDYIPNDRTQLINPKTNTPLELDIWIPNLNKAIECNGKYWHSFKKKQAIDTIKKALLNTDLLLITDTEWDNNVNACKHKILEFLKRRIKWH